MKLEKWVEDETAATPPHLPFLSGCYTVFIASLANIFGTWKEDGIKRWNWKVV